MPWFRVDDVFPEHRKVLALGEWEDLALALWLKAGCLSNRSLLDGRLPLAKVRGLINVDGWARHGQAVTVMDVVDALVRVGLWEIDGDTVVIHDYHDLQPTADRVLAERAAAKERKARWKERRSVAVPDAVPNGRENASGTRPPVPDPDPERTTFSSTTPLPPTGGWGRGPADGNLRQAAVEVVDLWNRLVAPSGLPAVDAATPSGLRRIQAALREADDLGWWETLFRRVAASRWCHGGNDRGFSVDLWWVVDKRLEVASGRYDDKVPVEGAAPEQPSIAAQAAALRRAKGV